MKLLRPICLILLLTGFFSVLFWGRYSGTEPTPVAAAPERPVAAEPAAAAGDEPNAAEPEEPAGSTQPPEEAAFSPEMARLVNGIHTGSPVRVRVGNVERQYLFRPRRVTAEGFRISAGPNVEHPAVFEVFEGRELLSDGSLANMAQLAVVNDTLSMAYTTEAGDFLIELNEEGALVSRTLMSFEEDSTWGHWECAVSEHVCSHEGGSCAHHHHGPIAGVRSLSGDSSEPLDSAAEVSLAATASDEPEIAGARVDHPYFRLGPQYDASLKDIVILMVSSKSQTGNSSNLNTRAASYFSYAATLADVYERQLGLRVRLQELILIPSDSSADDIESPTITTDTSTAQLNFVRDWAATHRPQGTHKWGHVMAWTNVDGAAGGTVGWAWIGSYGSASFGISLNERAWTWGVIVHELGHNVGANHTSGGAMNATVSKSNPQESFFTQNNTDGGGFTAAKEIYDYMSNPSRAFVSGPALLRNPNEKPFGVDDLVSTPVNTSLTFIPLPNDLLATSAWSQTNENLTLVEVGQVFPKAAGTAAVFGDAIVFAPAPSYTGNVWFSYTLRGNLGNGGHGWMHSADVIVTVGGNSSDPSLSPALSTTDNFVEVDFAGAIRINPLLNDEGKGRLWAGPVHAVNFNDGSLITADGAFRLVSAAVISGNGSITLETARVTRSGTSTLDNTGYLVYTPDSNDSDPVIIEYTVADADGNLSISTITINQVDPREIKATGIVIGTPGSYGGGDNTKDKVFDDDLDTFFDAANASGDWAGLDLGSTKQITRIRYAPRSAWPNRMVGGQFQGANTADFSSGVVTFYTVPSSPPTGVLTEVLVGDTGTYRYVRYIGPDEGWCNVAEVEFYTEAAPAAPTGLLATAEPNGDVSLDWDDNTEVDLAAYRVYRSTIPGSYETPLAANVPTSSYTDSSADNGTTYYYVVTALDDDGYESARSNQVAATPFINEFPPVVDAGPDQSAVLSGEAPWTPANIATVVGWYDASDTATITETGGAVSQWDDKSGNGLNLSQGEGTRQPLTGTVSMNGVNALKFDGSNDRMATSSNPFGAAVDNAFVIAVHKVDAVANGTFFTLTGSRNNVNRWQSHAPWGNGTIFLDNGGGAAPNRISTSYGVTAGTNVMVGFYGSTTDNVQQIFKNGSVLIEDASGHSVATVGNIFVGGDGGTDHQNTSIGEFIIVNGNISTVDRQKLEGYLAHKWGLAASLPVDHPYKEAAPGGSGAVVNLAGTVTDADGDTPESTWSVQSGPADVSFGNPSALETTAVFTELGSYILRLTAFDGFFTSYDEVTITVTEEIGSGPDDVAADFGTDPGKETVTSAGFTTIVSAQGTETHVADAYRIAAGPTAGHDNFAFLQTFTGMAQADTNNFRIVLEASMATLGSGTGNLYRYGVAMFADSANLEWGGIYALLFYNNGTLTVTLRQGLNGTILASGNLKTVEGNYPENETYTFEVTGVYFINGDLRLDFSLSDGINTTVVSTTVNPADYPGELFGGGARIRDGFSVDFKNFSLQVNPADLILPDAPTNLQATPGVDLVDLTWDAITDLDFASYNVYRAKAWGDYNEPLTTGLTGNTFTDNSAMNGRTYFYVVTAVNLDGNESFYSDEATATADGPLLVSEGPTGLLYETYANEGQINKVNTVPDYSRAGYMGGGVEIPFVPAAITLSPSGGDDTVAIQNAINDVSALPLGADGFRGAVVLSAGEYTVSSTLNLNTSGVVIRGAGQQEIGGTRITYTATVQSNLFEFYGASGPSASGSIYTITDAFVPVGSRTINVTDASSFAPGDLIQITNTMNQKWIDDLDTGWVGWTPGAYQLKTPRYVESINGNELTLDAPIMQTIEDQYGGGNVQKMTWSDALSNVGLEGIRAKSTYVAEDDQDHGWYVVDLRRVRNGWVRQVTSRYFGRGLVTINNSAQLMTVEDCAHLDPKSSLAGGNRYSFNVDDGSYILFQRCLTRNGRHDFVTGSRVAGPIVFVDALSTEPINDTGPHQRYSFGHLYDNIKLIDNPVWTNDAMRVQNRTDSGTGHGWAGAQIMFWNNEAPEFVSDAPVGAINWSIGNVGTKAASTRSPWEAFGIWQSHGTPVPPRSLYYAQLVDRLGPAFLRNVILPAQETGRIWTQLETWDGNGMLLDNLIALLEEPEPSAGNSIGIRGRIRDLAIQENAFTANWSLVSGPQAVVFADSSSLDTSVTVPEPGDYTLQLTVDDGTRQLTSMLTINVVGFATLEVNYSGNGNTAGTAPVDTDSPYSLDATVTVLGNTGSLTRTGYSFNGWNTSADGSGTSYAPGATFVIGSNTTLYAHWYVPLLVDAGSDQTIEIDGAAPWNPADLLTVAGWYDASDAGTLSATDGGVSQWADKSGNELHLTQASSTLRPLTSSTTISGLNALKFDGVDDVLVTATNPFGASIQDAFVIAVHRVDSMESSGYLFSLSGSNSWGSRWHVAAPLNSGAIDFRIVGNEFFSASSALSAGETVLLGTYGSVTEQVRQIFKNGALLNSIASCSLANTGSGIQVGRADNLAAQNTSIGEFIVINGTISNQDRQSLEGYLAHKWDLVASLPAEHPYQEQAPGSHSAIVNLEGNVTGGDSQNLITLWSVVSGPGAVSFDDASAINTTATFFDEGTYVLRLTADDGITQTTSDVTITVNPPVEGINVFYNGNGNTGGDVPVDANNPYDDSATATVLGNTGSLIRTGYSFADWNTSADGSGTAYAPGATFTISATTNLYAQWTSNSYTVTFDKQGGTGGSDSVTAVLGEAMPTATAPTLSGNAFEGYFTQPSGEGVQYYDAFMSSARNWDIEEASTLFAHWTPAAPILEVTRVGSAIIAGGVDGISGTGVDQETTITYTLTNSGDEALEVDTPVIVGGIQNCVVVINTQPATGVGIGQSTGLTLAVTPSAEGTWSFSVSISSSDAANSPYAWTVTGVAGGGDQSGEITLTAVEDTYINSQSAGTNYGTETKLRLNTQTGGNPNNRLILRSILRFDLSSIPAGVTVQSAQLQFIQSNTASGSVDVREMTGSWSETGATWSNSNSLFGSFLYGSADAPGSIGEIVSFTLNADARTKIQDWLATPTSNHGFGITATNSGNNTAFIALRSREDVNDANRPKLTFEYTTDGESVDAPLMVVTRDSQFVAPSGEDVIAESNAGVGTQLSYAVENLGTADLSLTTPVQISGTSNCSVTVNTEPTDTVVPSGSSPLVLTVTPSAAGAWSATVSIANSDPDKNPYIWTISGSSEGGPDPIALSVSTGPDQNANIGEAGLWTPIAISTAAWYDATDADSIIQSSGEVSQWSDKSGNDNHAMQPTSAVRPTTGSETLGGLNAIAFRIGDGTNKQFLSAPDAVSLNLDASGGANVFAVMRYSGFVDQGSGLNVALGKGQILSAASAYGIRVGNTSTIGFKAALNGDVNTTSYTNQEILFSGTGTTTLKTARVFINGELRNTTSTMDDFTSDNTSPLYIGRDATANRHANVDFGEIIVIGDALFDADRERIEGYLAHKWNQVNQLPAEHPYKVEAPAGVGAIVPISGSITAPEGATVTTLWTLQSGPAPVTFADASAVDTEVTFTEEGTYILRLTADDGVTTIYDELTITVLPDENTPPAAPTGLFASPGDSEIALDWTVHPDPDVASYNVYRSQGPGSNGFVAIAIGLTSSQFTDGTAPNDVTYIYRVTAVKSNDAESLPSEEVTAMAEGPLLVSVGENGLVYQTYANEGQTNKVNTVPDYSRAGYMGGGMPIPFVPSAVTLSPSGGDDTTAIQDAIDTVSALPLVDGFRGAVVLSAGDYSVSSTLNVNTSGVVIRGAGQQEIGGTRITYTATTQSNLFHFHGSANPSIVGGSARDITEAYVPVGAKTLNVSDATGYAPGDLIRITNQMNQQWIDDVGMSLVDPQWDSATFQLNHERYVVAVNGNELTLDAPIVQAIETQYGGGRVERLTFTGAIEQVGIENIRLESTFVGDEDEDHGWVAVEMRRVKNGWLRQVTGRYFGMGLFSAREFSQFLTVEDSASLDPKSISTGMRKYSFNVDDASYVLVQRCLTRGGRHDFVTGSVTPGPNVFVDGLATQALSDSGPHFRYATGELYDNIKSDNDINVQNRLNAGTSDGWAGAQIMFWNVEAAAIRADAPTGAMNWSIGATGTKAPGQSFMAPDEPFGIWQSHNVPVTPRSLYYAQLADRLGTASLRDVILPSQFAGRIWSELQTWDGDGLFLGGLAIWREAADPMTSEPFALEGVLRDLTIQDAGFTLLWSKVSGPGVVTFGNNAALATTVTVSQPGAYTLQLSASDGTRELTASIELVFDGEGEPPVLPDNLIDFGTDPEKVTVTEAGFTTTVGTDGSESHVADAYRIAAGPAASHDSFAFLQTFTGMAQGDRNDFSIFMEASLADLGSGTANNYRYGVALFANAADLNGAGIYALLLYNNNNLQVILRQGLNGTVLASEILKNVNPYPVGEAYTFDVTGTFLENGDLEIEFALTDGTNTQTVSVTVDPANYTGELFGGGARIRNGFSVDFDNFALNVDIPEHTAPDAPANLVATPGVGLIDLSWDTNAEPAAVSYNVYRRETSGSYGAALASGLTSNAHTDLSPENDVAYFYVVTAVDTNGSESLPSNEISITIVADSVGNGIDDAWEIQYFGEVGLIDGSGDADGDGVLDFFEYLYGSDPTDASDSGFEVLAEKSEQGAVVFTWAVLDGFEMGVHYEVQISTNLSAWDVIPEGHFTLDETPVGNRISLELTLTHNYGDRVFLRLLKP